MNDGPRRTARLLTRFPNVTRDPNRENEMSNHARFAGQLRTDADLVCVLRDHGIDHPREDNLWHLAANRLEAVMAQRDALLAACRLCEARNELARRASLAPKPEVVDMNEIVRDWLAPKPEGGEGNTPYCASCADLVKALSRQRDHLERMRATGLWVAEQESALRDIRATLGLMPTPDAAKGEK